MPTIVNLSMYDVSRGAHANLPNSILIQIQDPGLEFVNPQGDFQEVYQFHFWDNETSCTYEQAEDLASILENALAGKQNVVVHCHAGLCRSGAVVEVGTMLGFKDTKRARIPNIRVKGLMLKALGWTY